MGRRNVLCGTSSARSGGLEVIRSVEGIAIEVWKRHTGIYLRHDGGAFMVSLAVDVDEMGWKIVCAKPLQH